MLQIAICDDNEVELAQIIQIDEAFKASHTSRQDIQYETFRNGLDLLMAVIDDGTHFDIMDIVMPLMTGIEVASEIRKKNTVSKIIFLTSSYEFAVDS